jgi:hypothetical protein
MKSDFLIAFLELDGVKAFCFLFDFCFGSAVRVQKLDGKGSAF